ncbi:MAG TPA: hypothetical protein VF050_00350, partial [Moraxellaceae bacterium]
YPSTSTATKCDSKTVVCVDGRFIDGAVSNLDYECGQLKGVTDPAGTFTCPAGSLVTFSLKNPSATSSDAKKVILGSVTVIKPASLGTATPTYFYVTPSLLGGSGVAVNNIVRFLQAVNSQTLITDMLSPAHIVSIANDDKRKLDQLSSTVTAADFSSPSFDSKVAPFLAALTPARTMMASTDPRIPAIIKMSQYSTVAGIFITPGFLVDTTNFNPNTASSGIGMSGSSSTKSLIAALWTMIDRKGRVAGVGVYSYEDFSVGADHVISKNAKAMEVDAVPFGAAGMMGGAPVWPLSGNIQGMTYRLFDATEAPVAGTKIEMQQGTLRGDAIVGSDTIYKNLYGEPLVVGAVNPLGRWQLSTPVSANDILKDNTTLTLTRSVPAAPTLDPNAWKNIAASLPMSIEVTFFNSDFSALCGGTGTSGPGCQLGSPVHLTVLSDGNVVSDTNHDCNGGINQETLNDGAVTEMPVGFVRNIFQRTGTNEIYMGLAVMLPKNAVYSADLQQIQFATNFGGEILLRVDAKGVNSNYLKVYDGNFSESGAAWVSALTLLRASDSTKTQSERDAFRVKSYGRMSSVPDPACP